MKLLRKLVAFIFIMSLMLTILPVQMTTFAATEDHDARMKKLMDFGIYSINDDMEYDTELIKRENMASILSVFYGVTEESYPVDTIFDDVSTNWASGHIMTMVDNGIMNGYSDGLFRPMDYVTGDAAIKTLVSMAGYGFLAEHKGGYPEGYRRMAAELNMLKGLETLDKAANITRGEFTTLLYNALDVPVLEQITAGATNKFETNATNTLLSKHLNIYRGKGVINALPYVSTGLGEGAGAGKIHLDNVAFLCQLDAYPYLGEYVDVYFRQGADGDLSEIISIEPRKNSSNTITVEAVDIVSYNNYRFTYMANEREKSLTLPRDVLVIFNGKPLPYFTNAHMTPKQGNVRFCDLDDNGVYEIAIITYEIDYHVATVDRSSTVRITDVDGLSENKTALVINKEDNSYYYSVNNAGQSCDLEDIQPNEIISVAADNIDVTTGEILPSSRVYHIARCETRVKGVVQSISDNEIVVDGKTLELSYSCQQKSKKVVIGKEYTFYYNYLGKIADFDEKDTSSRYKYGILVKAGTEGGVFDKSTKVQIFNQDGVSMVTMCADNLQIDGYSKKAYEKTHGNAMNYLKASSIAFGNITGIPVPDNGVWQLIKYVADDTNLIASIDTIQTNVNPSTSDLTHGGSTKTGGHSYVDRIYETKIGENTSEYTRHTLDGNCVIFAYDTNKPIDDIDNLSISALNVLSRNTNEADHFFDPDELGVQHAMIRSAVDFNVAIDVLDPAATLLYLGEKQVVDASGELKYVIHGIQLTTGAAINITLTDRSVLTSAGVVPGDIVQYILNKNKEATAVSLSLNIEAGSTGTMTTTATAPSPFTRYGKSLGWGGQIFGEVTGLAGVVRTRNADYIKFESSMSTSVGPKDFSQGSIETTFWLYYLQRVMIYDSASNKVSQGSIDDIRMADDYGNDNADLVVGFKYSGQLKTIIIYR